MDGKRFDGWVRSVARSRSRRSALGLLASSAIVFFGIGAAGAKDDRTSARARHDGSGREDRHAGQRRPGAGRPEGGEGHVTRKQAEGESRKGAGTKKATRTCVGNGGSCRKPKRGKAPTCCTGLTCGRTSQKCECPRGKTACRGACIAADACCGGCGNGQECVEGACVGDAECDREGLETCLISIAEDLDAAYAGCAEPCAEASGARCATCLEDALAPFAEQLATCAIDSCADRGARAALRAQVLGGDVGSAPVGTCAHRAQGACNVAALATATAPFVGIHALVAGCAGVPHCVAGVIAGAEITAAAGFLNCWAQFGCETGYCNAGDVCCRLWGSRGCGSKGKVKCCPPGGICTKGVCRAPCPNGRQKCGAICCPTGQICKNGACQPETCVRNGRGRSDAAGCCLPATCAEMGKACGTQPDGCGGTIDCGSCSHLGPRAVCLEYEGTCSCSGDDFCHGCGMQDNGCGLTFNCGDCRSESSPKAYCGSDRQCHCTPDTCADLGKTCGTWADGCGSTITCGPQELLCNESSGMCCAEGQTCCRTAQGVCCDWPVCDRWPGGALKGCCPDIQQCVQQGGGKTCCPEGWRCRGAGDPAHRSENCCVLPGHGDAALHIDSSLCCSGELASMHPHICA